MKRLKRYLIDYNVRLILNGDDTSVETIACLRNMLLSRSGFPFA